MDVFVRDFHAVSSAISANYILICLFDEEELSVQFGFSRSDKEYSQIDCQQSLGLHKHL